MNSVQLNPEQLNELEKLRLDLNRGDNASQKWLDEIYLKWKGYKDILLNDEKDELFHLVDSKGNFNRLIAPRWICHLLGLRHKSVHLLLKWQSFSLGSVFVFQIRSWKKSESPGHLDISVAGHVVGDSPKNTFETAYREMKEELGLVNKDLKDGKLIFINGYESYNKNRKNNFYNSEWRDIVLGEITIEGFDKIRFSDKEVVGLYLCPVSEANNLLTQKIIPIASALEPSLQKCL